MSTIARRVGVLATVLLLAGEGCYPFARDPSGDLIAPNPEGVAITQGPPPSDCGQRNPNRFFPYFTIPNATVTLGDSVYIDASCSVGRIVRLRWDFDTQGWPQNIPTEQRFEPEIPVDHQDERWPADQRPRGGIWPLNNFGPFFLYHTPTTPGTKSMRLWAKDWQGNERVVLHTYVVLPMSGVHLGNLVPLRSHFEMTALVRPNPVFVPRYRNGQRVYLPRLNHLWHGNAYGSAGPISAYSWRMRNDDTGVDEDVDNRALAFGVAGLPPLRILPHLFQPTLATGMGSKDVTISFEVESTDGPRERDSHRYRLIDPVGWTTLVGQLALIPGDDRNVLNLYERRYGDIYRTADPGIFFRPGDAFTLQNYSILGIATFGAPRQYQNGTITIEFDPGVGTYEQVADVPAQIVTDLDQLYGSSFVNRTYPVPTRPGQYVAKMRITESALPPQIQFQRSEIGIPFEVLPAETAPVVTPSQPTPPASAPTPASPAAPAPRATPAPTASEVSATVNPISPTGQPIPPPRYMDDALLFMVRGLSAALHQRIAWDFDGDGSNDSSCDVTEPYTGAGYSTCTSSRKDAPQTPGAHTARLTVTPKNGAPFTVPLQYDVLADTRAAATTSVEIPSISPELYAENKNGARMRNNPEIYENDSIIIRLNGLNTVAKKVRYDFQNDGTFDVDCDVRQNQGALQCLQYRRVSWRTPPGDYVARIRVHFAGNAGQLDYTLPYTVVRGERPADRQS